VPGGAHLIRLLVLDRRLVPRPARGVVASVVLTTLLAVLLSGCGSDEVPIDSPDVPAADREACAALVEALPDRLFGELRRPVDPDDALGAAWGDPAVELRCGVGVPTGYDEFSPCIEVRRVGWFVPQAQLEDLGGEAVATVLTHAPRVELTVPADYRTIGVDQALADLAPVVRNHLEPGKPCH
jgi:hypothetical protein